MEGNLVQNQKDSSSSEFKFNCEKSPLVNRLMLLRQDSEKLGKFLGKWNRTTENR